MLMAVMCLITIAMVGLFCTMLFVTPDHTSKSEKVCVGLVTATMVLFVIAYFLWATR